MELKQLKLENFKGLNFELNTNGNNVVNVYAANRKGKTRIYDGFCFNFFGKDSEGNSDFSIKNIKETGEVEHGLEHSVTTVLENPDITLKRTFTELWGKRGKLRGVFKGHTTNYEIDGTPNKKKKDYDEVVNSICDEKIFKLLTDPHHFNDKLHWKKRLEILAELSGGMVTDEDVINAHPELSDFHLILDGKSADDRKVTIKESQKKIDEKKDEIKPAIRENKHHYNNEVRKKDEIDKDIEAALEELKDLEETLKEIRAGGESEVLVSKLRKVENQIQDLDNKEAAESLKARQARDDERRKLWKNVEDLNYSIELIEKDQKKRWEDLDFIEGRISEFETVIEDLRAEWHKEDETKFEFKESDTCALCRRKLPENQIEQNKNRSLDIFNKNKAKILESINLDGKAVSAKKKVTEKEYDDLSKKIVEFDKTLKKYLEELPAAEKALKDFDDQQEVIPEDPEKLTLLKEKETLEKQIEDKKGSVDPEAIKEGEAQIEAIEIRIEAYKKELLHIEANKRIDVRVKELDDQERKLSAEFEELERQLYLTEKFIRTKVGMLEEKINAKFKIARFKLFEEQINEGLKECCTAVIDGVPYGSMNNASRLNIGLDICNTLSEYHGVTVPIWLDNCEAITRPIETKAQQIRLYVSKDDPELRVE